MNRAFLYGDLLFETIRVERNRVFYSHLHADRLNYGFGLLGMDARISAQELEKKAFEACGNKADARVRLVAYRAGEGTYLPLENNVIYEAESFPLKQETEQDRIIGIFENYKKPCNAISNLKSGNALIYVMAAKHAQEQSWHEALILNERANICEATGSNIFITKDNVIYTPPLSEGCVMGIQRSVILGLTNLPADLHLVETPLKAEDLWNADEIFLTNAIRGIMPVMHKGIHTISNRLKAILDK